MQTIGRMTLIGHNQGKIGFAASASQPAGDEGIALAEFSLFVEPGSEPGKLEDAQQASLVLIRACDEHSPSLYRAAIQGERFVEIRILFFKLTNGSNPDSIHSRYLFSDAVITKLVQRIQCAQSSMADAQIQHTEELHIAYRSLRMDSVARDIYRKQV